MADRWPRASRGIVDSPHRPVTDDRWGVARLVAQREAERRAAATPEPADGAVVEEPEPPRTPAPRPSEPAVPPAPRAPLRPGPPAPPRPLPAPRRPAGRVPGAFDERLTRPRIDPDPDLFGFARHTRGRIGSRVFTAFFLLVFALIVAQTVISIVQR